MAAQSSIYIMSTLLACPLVLNAERRFSKLPVLPEDVQETPLPSLSIVVPARNEAANLRRLLPSLTNAAYAGQLEVIVVDDESSDQTSVVAKSLGAAVIKLDGVAEGWSGKSQACHQGARAAKGEWLLFTDADTVHQSSGPARAVAYAEKQQLDGLSIFVRQQPRGLLDGAALMAAFAGLFGGMREDSAILNGQYILLRKDVYEESGGFANSPAEAMEDLALGFHLRSKGFKVPLLQSEDAASVEMYSEKAALWHGLSRISAGSLSWLGFRSIIPVMMITGVMSPILALTNAVRTGKDRAGALASWLLITASFAPWAQRFGSRKLALLAPIGALFVQAAAVSGLFSRLLGRGTKWKGRRI